MINIVFTIDVIHYSKHTIIYILYLSPTTTSTMSSYLYLISPTPSLVRPKTHTLFALQGRGVTTRESYRAINCSCEQASSLAMGLIFLCLALTKHVHIVPRKQQLSRYQKHSITKDKYSRANKQGTASYANKPQMDRSCDSKEQISME